MIFSDPLQKSEPLFACYEFGSFHLDPTKRLLMRAGARQPLASKAFDTLLVLLANRHHVVDKDDLIRQVWGGRLVAENNLNQKIAQLRRVLGETPQHHQYIVTIPGQGYQFVASVREVVCAEHMTTMQPRGALPAAEAVRSRSMTIAVLPFEVLGAGENEYLGLCLTDALITRLSKLDLPGLVVAPAANAPSQPADAGNLSNLGKRQGIGFALKGRVRMFDNRVRITVQLLKLEDGVTLWAEQFDETLTDWLLLEDSIARQITDALHLKIKSKFFAPLTSAIKSQVRQDGEAHRLYLKGQYFCDKRTPEGARKAMEYFTQALERDPTLALSYAGMAQAHLMLGFYEQLPQRETILMAEEAAAKALALDESLAEARVALAMAQMTYYFDWAAAQAEFDLVITANPAYAIGHQWYGYLLGAQGKFDAALKEATLAQQLDPLSLVIQASTGLLFYLARRHEEAAAVLRQTIEMDSYPMASLYLSFVYEQQGRFEEAIAEMNQAGKHYGNSSLLTASFSYLHARAGRQDEALKLLRQLHQQLEVRYVPPYYLALAYAGLGETDEALDWLEKAITDRSLWLLFLKVDPKLDGLRDDPRFLDLLRMMRLAEQ